MKIINIPLILLLLLCGGVTSAEVVNGDSEYGPVEISPYRESDRPQRSQEFSFETCGYRVASVQLKHMKKKKGDTACVRGFIIGTVRDTISLCMDSAKDKGIPTKNGTDQTLLLQIYKGSDRALHKELVPKCAMQFDSHHRPK